MRKPGHCANAGLLPLPSTRCVQTGMKLFSMLNVQVQHTVFTVTGLVKKQ